MRGEIFLRIFILQMCVTKMKRISGEHFSGAIFLLRIFPMLSFFFNKWGKKYIKSSDHAELMNRPDQIESVNFYFIIHKLHIFRLKNPKANAINLVEFKENISKKYVDICLYCIHFLPLTVETKWLDTLFSMKIHKDDENRTQKK